MSWIIKATIATVLLVIAASGSAAAQQGKVATAKKSSMWQCVRSARGSKRKVAACLAVKTIEAFALDYAICRAMGGTSTDCAPFKKDSDHDPTLPDQGK